jgi:phage terminase large subunit
MGSGSAERQFTALTESNRISGNMDGGSFPPRMYFTCNPGGVGHDWVKRLFIDRSYRDNEKPEDYVFIKSLVFDNKYLMEHNSGYVDTLMALPELRRRAMLYGDWNSFEGAFFPEFDYGKHSCEPFPLDRSWIKFRAVDYGLDMTCCLWLAVTREKQIIVYRELYESGLIISEAARKILEATPKNEPVRYTVASPDLWNRRQDSGKSGFEIMTANGLKSLQKANNARITGWRVMREYLKDGGIKDGKPKLVVFRSCENLLRCLPLLRFDEYTKEDAADTPHEITHAPEALRYAVMSREPLFAEKNPPFSGSVYIFDDHRLSESGGYDSFINY